MILNGMGFNLYSQMGHIINKYVIMYTTSFIIPLLSLLNYQFEIYAH